MVSKEENKYVIWPVYFDKSASKIQGRRVSKKHAVEKPSLENIAKAAKSLIHKGDVPDKILNMVEMAFRTYDPCFACSTHSLPGRMPLEVNIYDSDKKLIRTLKRD